jgi:hypothetical protein
MTLTELAALPMQELERLYCEKAQGYYLRLRNDEMRHQYMLIKPHKIGGAMGQALSGWYTIEAEAWAHCPAVTSDEWLAALDALPANIQFEFGLDDQGEPELRVRDSDFLEWNSSLSFTNRSEALKRAVLIATVYLRSGATL